MQKILNWLKEEKLHCKIMQSWKNVLFTVVHLKARKPIILWSLLTFMLSTSQFTKSCHKLMNPLQQPNGSSFVISSLRDFSSKFTWTWRGKKKQSDHKMKKKKSSKQNKCIHVIKMSSQGKTIISFLQTIEFRNVHSHAYDKYIQDIYHFSISNQAMVNP